MTLPDGRNQAALPRLSGSRCPPAVSERPQGGPDWCWKAAVECEKLSFLVGSHHTKERGVPTGTSSLPLRPSEWTGFSGRAGYNWLSPP